MMKTVVGIFASRADAEQAIGRLRALGIPEERINYLTPGASAAQLEDVPTTDAERPGVGMALGSVVGGATGISGGLLGAAIASVFVPVVGPVTAIGLAASALLGVGGAVAGAVAGSALDQASSEGLPKDELFVYTDALRQGRTVVIVLTDEVAEAEKVQEVLVQAGAESLDAARERWWLGLRDAEAETYTAQGGDFARDEVLYRRGFEAALRAGASGRPYEEVLEYLRTYYADEYGEEAFRRGYARGQAYYESLEVQYRQSAPGPGGL
jgi:hypothetical protein